MNLARAAQNRRGRRLSAAAALLVVLGGTARARTEPARRVVLVVPEASGPVATEALARVRGELQAARFDIESVVVAGNGVAANGAAANDARRAVVERALHKADARAAFGIFFGAGGAEIWVSDAVTGRTVVQTLPLAGAAPDRAAVLAVKAVDLLKATLAEIWVSKPAEPSVSSPAAPPPPPPVAPSAPRPTVVRPTPAPAASIRVAPAPLDRRVDLAAGVSWIGAAGASSWAPLLAVTISRGRLGGRLVAMGLGSATELGAAAGSVRVAYGLALAELAVRQRFGRHFETTAGLDAGAARLSIDGTGAPGYAGSATRVWSAAGGANVGAAVSISRFTVAVDARVLVSATATEVQIDGQDVLRAARPLFSIGGSVGVRL